MEERGPREKRGAVEGQKERRGEGGEEEDGQGAATGCVDTHKYRRREMLRISRREEIGTGGGGYTGRPRGGCARQR
jgi:hypothetical protein